MNFTIRRVHVIVAVIVVVVGLGAFFGARALSSGSGTNPQPAGHHALPRSTTVKPSTTTTAPVTTRLPTTTTSPPSPVMVTPEGGSVREPSTIDLGGAQGTTISEITWSSWGPYSAQGSGSAKYDECVPDCASGTTTVDVISLVLSRPENGIFTIMSAEDVTRGGSLGQSAFTYPSFWPVSAT
jgi:hypothetical protein